MRKVKDVEINKSVACLPVNNEDGFVLILAMMIMVVVTLIGLAATTTTVFEIQIAGNEKWAQNQFYKADSAVNEFIAQKPSLTNKDLACNPQSHPQGIGSCTSHIPTTCSEFSGNNYYHVAYHSLPQSTSPQLEIYYMDNYPSGSDPKIARLMFCSKSASSNTVASITAGVEIGLPPGAVPSPNTGGYNPDG